MGISSYWRSPKALINPMHRSCQVVVHDHGGNTLYWLFVNLLMHPMLTFCVTVQSLWCPSLWNLILLFSWYSLTPWLRFKNKKIKIWTRNKSWFWRTFLFLLSVIYKGGWLIFIGLLQTIKINDEKCKLKTVGKHIRKTRK